MQEFLYGFSGFRPLVDAVRLDPNLPPQLAGITLSNLAWQGRTFTMHIGPRETSLTLNSGAALPRHHATAERRPCGPVLHLSSRPAALISSLPKIWSAAARSRRRLRFRDRRRSPPSTEVRRQPGPPQNRSATLTVDLAAPVTLGTIKVLRGNRDPFPYAVEVIL